jgi:hypothetical protein
MKIGVVLFVTDVSLSSAALLCPSENRAHGAALRRAPGRRMTAWSTGDILAAIVANEKKVLNWQAPWHGD